MNNLRLTIHAIERYQERIGGDKPFAAAEAELRDACTRATKLKDKTVRGHFLWQVEEPALRLVTKRDLNAYIVVTVLWPKAEDLPSDLDLLQELLAEREAGLARLMTPPKPTPKPPATLPTSTTLVTLPKEPELPKNRRETLALEAQILSYEIAGLRQRETTLRHEISQAVHGHREAARAKNALRWALRGLLGQVSKEAALAEVVKGLGEGILSQDFLGFEK